LPCSRATQKEALLRPCYSKALNWQVVSTDAFDTDQLGTFSGETSRTLSPSDCAARKAHLACELTGLSMGLGSEGSLMPALMAPCYLGIKN